MIRQRRTCLIIIWHLPVSAVMQDRQDYAASKAGVIGLTKTAAREVASRGITVNAVAPIYRDRHDRSTSGKDKKASAAQIPLGKFGKAEDVANAVAFLRQEDGYITDRYCM